MSILTRKTDPKGRLQLPGDFADCLVAVERIGDELRIHDAAEDEEVRVAIGRKAVLSENQIFPLLEARGFITPAGKLLP